MKKDYQKQLAQWRAERIRILRLHKKGLSDVEIGEILGITRQAVRKRRVNPKN